jgi:NTE family protein
MCPYRLQHADGTEAASIVRNAARFPDHGRQFQSIDGGLGAGGGALRGFAHVGVLRALQEAGIKPDIVVGTSAGAVDGAAYASGMTADQIDSAARHVELSSLIDLTWASGGFMRGNNLAKWFDAVTSNVPIERFPIRFAAIATDLKSETPVLVDSGSAGRAIQTSAALPGVNVPVPYDRGHLIDGCITSLVSVRSARAMGAAVVIAVDIYCQGPRNDGMSIPSVLSRVMRTQSCLVAAPETAEADVLIAPAVSVSGMSAKYEQDRAIQAGYEAARAALPRLMQGGPSSVVDGRTSLTNDRSRVG